MRDTPTDTPTDTRTDTPAVPNKKARTRKPTAAPSVDLIAVLESLKGLGGRLDSLESGLNTLVEGLNVVNARVTSSADALQERVSALEAPRPAPVARANEVTAGPPAPTGRPRPPAPTVTAAGVARPAPPPNATGRTGGGHAVTAAPSGRPAVPSQASAPRVHVVTATPAPGAPNPAPGRFAHPEPTLLPKPKEAFDALAKAVDVAIKVTTVDVPEPYRTPLLAELGEQRRKLKQAQSLLG